MKKKSLSLILIAVMLLSVMTQVAFADPEEGSRSGGEKAVRTIMLYDCGSNLETQAGMATFNLHQILRANFSKNDDVRFIVMTGGSDEWHLESKYISVENQSLLPEGEPADGVSVNYNQIWEARGADDPTYGTEDDGEKHGKMVLVDGDGITKDTPVKSEDELMSNKETLRAFIDLCVEKYPAEKYDLILWDHGGGPTDGFGLDDHDPLIWGTTMPFSGIVDAIAHNSLTDPGEGKTPGKFDFIDFDACLMNSIELNLMLADYADYYVASPETEPGYGQDYEGWLNTLGDEPDKNTFELGKEIVDDFIAFYADEDGEGNGQQGTLAVVDLGELMDRGLADMLQDLTDVLKDQVESGLFYDEMLSTEGSINYGMDDFYDLGNLAGLLSVVSSELSEEQAQGGTYSNENAYSAAGIAARIGGLLNDEEVIYADGTEGISSADQLYRLPNGDVEFGDLTTSGMYIYFATSTNPLATIDYHDEMTKVIEMLPVKDDGRYKALKDYMDVMVNYALVNKSGKAVNRLINEKNVDKQDISYDTVKDFWKSFDKTIYSDEWSWTYCIKKYLDLRGGETEEMKTWLGNIISQQADEAIMLKNISAKKLKQKDGTGYRITIDDAKKRIIKGVNRTAVAEVPAMVDYVEKNYDKDVQKMILSTVDIPMATEKGDLTDDDILERESIEDVIKWYNEKNSTWTTPAAEEKVYAIKDASGNLHAAALLGNDEDEQEYTVELMDRSGKREIPLTISFKEGEDGKCKISEMSFISEGGDRPVKPEDLTGTLKLMPILYLNYYAADEFFLPISESTFELSADNADKISLVYTDIRDVSDIGDVDGDGESLHNTFTVTDIYDNELDITDKVNKADQTLIDIKLARVKPAQYTGEVLTPEVVYRGETLTEGKDYTWDFMYVEEGTPRPELKETGEYELLLKGIGDYTGYSADIFYIVLEEDLAETLLEQAQDEYDAAMRQLNEAITEADFAAARTRLLNAKAALEEAAEELELTRKAMSQDKQRELEDEIDALKDKVEELNNELDEAKIVDISSYKATIKKKTYTYTGNYIYPKPTVSGLAESECDIYYIDNKKVGTAAVEIKGKGRYYKGKIRIPFKIVPKKAAISKVKAGKRKLNVKAKVKVSKTGGAKYEVRYRAKGSSKWKKVTGSKQTITIRKLKKGKRYQVKIRAFRKVGKKTYYGAWSKVKTSGKVR